MADQIITLTTDFGTSSPFVAAIKGVILSINPLVRIVDLSHDIPPYDVRHAAFFLAEAVPYFPPGTVHVVVVDPDVGSERPILCVCLSGQRLIVPDNGCWTLLAGSHTQPLRVVRVTEKRFWRPTVSPTFHGRDIFASVAAHLSLSGEPTQFGPSVSEWKRLNWPAPVRDAHTMTGEIIFVDHFGNLISNIPGAALQSVSGHHFRASVGSTTVPCVRTYADGARGDLVSLVSSSGLLEIAEVQGNAARRLGLGVGAPIRVEWQS